MIEKFIPYERESRKVEQARLIKGRALLVSNNHTAVDPFPQQHMMIKRAGQIGGKPRWEGASVSPNSGQSFVRLEAVSKSYGSGHSQVEVLNEVQLELPRGQPTASSADPDQGSRLRFR
jgi:hypothetical protein